jgi:CubicO group peptidase (beta-lactamase class C family)
MDEETWMNADEALADGYADAVIVATVPDNHFDLSTFTNVPKEIADRFGKRDTPTQPEPEHDNMTPEQFKAKHKDVVDGWLNDEAAETYANAKNDAKAMLEACGGDKAAALDAWLEGKSIDEARNARTQTIEEQLAETKAKLEAAEARAKELENGADPVAVNPAASVDKDNAEDGIDPKTLAVFKAAKRMKNDMGRNAYLSDRGIELNQYTDWLESNG